MGRKQSRQDEAPLIVPSADQGNTEQAENAEPRYVVLREGHRVSMDEYEAPDDPRAISELEFWRKVENNHSWGAPVVIVKYENHLHRAWGSEF